MKGFLILLAAIIIQHSLEAQAINYTTANAHSHNNYTQQSVFWEAYNLQYGSIEADIYLSSDGKDCWVAHDKEDTATIKRSLDSLYLQPLLQCVQQNNGYVYANHSRQLQLMIDIKSEAVPALEQLIKMISKYPLFINNPSLKFVISGNRPDASQYNRYPSFIWFDGEPDCNYNGQVLAKIAMISASFQKYTKWEGYGPIPKDQKKILERIIKQSYDLKKPIRFWATPDSEQGWKQLMKWKVDFINTDKVAALADYLETSTTKK